LAVVYDLYPILLKIIQRSTNWLYLGSKRRNIYWRISKIYNCSTWPSICYW